MGLIEDTIRKAEEDRARAEGREPDFDNPAGVAGVVLNPAESVVAVFGEEEGPESEEPTPVAAELEPILIGDPDPIVVEVPVDVETLVDEDEDE